MNAWTKYCGDSMPSRGTGELVEGALGTTWQIARRSTVRAAALVSEVSAMSTDCSFRPLRLARGPPRTHCCFAREAIVLSRDRRLSHLPQSSTRRIRSNGMRRSVLPLFAVVETLVNRPEDGLPKGARGAVVDLLAEDGEAYEIEVVDEFGRTTFVGPLRADEITRMQ